jgi:hypothetical protein
MFSWVDQFDQEEEKSIDMVSELCIRFNLIIFATRWLHIGKLFLD